jgi:hypothetical protein
VPADQVSAASVRLDHPSGSHIKDVARGEYGKIFVIDVVSGFKKRR